MFGWLSFTQTLAAVIAGCEAAWKSFGGVFGVLVPDNMSAIVADADPVNPTFTVGWLDYAQACGFVTDPARVRSPKDKPRVERVVQYVRGNFFADETFVDLADAQLRVEVWCATTAGLRVHGTTGQRPAELFTADEQPRLLPVPAAPYDVPIFATPKVARDLHIEVARGLCSVPAELIGQRVQVRADSRLVKVFSRHPGTAHRGHHPDEMPPRNSRLRDPTHRRRQTHRDIRRSIKRALARRLYRKSRPQPDSTTPASFDKHRASSGLLRQYLPRRLDFRTLTQADLNAIAPGT